MAAEHKAISLRRDMSDDAQVAAMVDRTLAEFGRLDIAFRCQNRRAAIMIYPLACL